VARDDRTHNNYRGAAVEYVFEIRYLGRRTAPSPGGSHPGSNSAFNTVHRIIGTVNYRQIHTFYREPTRAGAMVMSPGHFRSLPAIRQLELVLGNFPMIRQHRIKPESHEFHVILSNGANLNAR